MVGAFTGGRLADAIGRKRTMVLVALTYAVFAVLSGVASSLVFLDTARFFLGVTIGISIVTAPIFVAESSPAAEAWRWMLALSAVPSLLVLAVLARLPDTPRCT